MIHNINMQYDIKLHINIMWGGMKSLYTVINPLRPALLFYSVYNNNIYFYVILLVKRKSIGA